jgi:DNA-binding IclR family transcriptional regulator
MTATRGSTALRASLAPAVTRAAAILDVLSREPRRAMGPSELGRRVGAAKSSVANICNAMVDAGLLRQVEGGYALGQRLVEYGEAYLAGVDLVEEFHEACLQLGEDLEETVQLAVLDGLDVVYLARRDGRHPLRLASEVGRHLPATCTATGKALLAELDADELERRLAGRTALSRLTDHSLTSSEALREDLSAVRSRGYSVDDEESVEGVRSLALSVPSRPGQTSRAAVSVTLLKARCTPEREARLLGVLGRLTRMLGGVSGPPRPSAPSPRTP